MTLQVDVQWVDVIVNQKQTNCIQRTSICVVAGFEGTFVSSLNKCYLPAQSFDLPLNPAIIAYTMLWAGFIPFPVKTKLHHLEEMLYLFCNKIHSQLTLSQNIFQAFHQQNLF